MQMPDFMSWEWLSDPGGVIAALIAAAAIALLAIGRKKMTAAVGALRNRHAERMRDKYATPCERAHVDDLPRFVHPARFEVQGHVDPTTNATGCVLVNVGKGDALGVTAESDPLGNVELRGAASWDMIKSGAAEPIQLTCDMSDLLFPQSIRVAWREAAGDVHIEDAPLVDGADIGVVTRY
ncbi:hypothetical protein [Myceligenerans salitolerans]|uniref:Uncharacterized protein n=1 Tax=Myceligenerans salitolerans TaxID=1230528 RepID=A0ABS3IA80_9MICO|nr:hypothetical protein [Myceligenerans salitolerans]MBO0609864.1 hypothetical protein [Myceligenerans salitolerans]